MNSAFHVSICGGGLGGLMLAVVIGKYGALQTEMFESGPTINTIGSGISLYARTMTIMKEMGLYNELVKLAIEHPPGSISITRKSDQRDGYHWYSLPEMAGTLSLHRKDLVDFLLRHIPSSCKIHVSKKLEFYRVHTETGKISLHFSDGSTAVTDVLVGSDGIHSATRQTMYQSLASSSRDDGSRKRLLECIDPVWTGIMVYRCLVPTAKLVNEYPDIEARTLYVGKNKHIVTYPISQGQSINAVIFIRNSETCGKKFEGRWVEDVSEKEISDQFEGWEDRVRALAKAVEKPSRWVLHSLRSLPHYVNGRVALLGDAAHAMEPHFGVGAGQAIEDAFILGRLLTHELTVRGNVSDALKVYEEVRLPFANSIVQRSREIGRYYNLHVAPTGGSTPAQIGPKELHDLRKSIVKAWRWQNESFLTQWDEAEARWRAMGNARARL